jgi:hypothetical protein
VGERATRTARVEQRIGRRLTAAEQHIDVEAIDELLNKAKDRLEQAIRDEQARAAKRIARGRGGELRVTDDMLQVLQELRGHGRRNARLELDSMGYKVRRRDRRFDAVDDDLEARLRAFLRSLTVKVRGVASDVATGTTTSAAVGADVSTVAVNAIEKAVGKVLGARAIAADLVSPAFVSGLQDTFEQHLDLVQAWQYTAVNDPGSCEECAPHDGEVYETLEALFEVLPDFGPNPDCLGGDRCRCRAVPMPPE